MNRTWTFVIATLCLWSGAALGAKDMFIVAHPDDDLFFMNPDIEESIKASRDVVVVVVTAGDIAPGTWQEPIWRLREKGSINAYTDMALRNGLTPLITCVEPSIPHERTSCDSARA